MTARKPKRGPVRTMAILVRLTPAEMARIAAAAEADGRTRAEWVRRIALMAAESVGSRTRGQR